MRRPFQIIAAAVVMTTGSVSVAQEHDSAIRVFNSIFDYSDRICTAITVEGSSQEIEASGAVKAEVGSLVSWLVDANIEGAAQYSKHEWQGVLQKDLAAAIASSNECRLKAFDVLHKALLENVNTPSLPPLEFAKKLYEPQIQHNQQKKDEQILVGYNCFGRPSLCRSTVCRSWPFDETSFCISNTPGNACGYPGTAGFTVGQTIEFRGVRYQCTREGTANGQSPFWNPLISN